MSILNFMDTTYGTSLTVYAGQNQSSLCLFALPLFLHRCLGLQVLLGTFPPVCFLLQLLGTLHVILDISILPPQRERVAPSAAAPFEPVATVLRMSAIKAQGQILKARLACTSNAAGF
jgi:hypothetical protein